jgi:hypothetical protein
VFPLFHPRASFTDDTVLTVQRLPAEFLEVVDEFEDRSVWSG